MMSLVPARRCATDRWRKNSSKAGRYDAHILCDDIYRNDKSIVNNPAKALSVTFRRGSDALIAIVPFERAALMRR